MRRTLFRNVINAISGVTLALAACRPVKQVTALGREIGQEFGRPIVVSVNQHSLILVVPGSPQGDTTEPAALARHVAEYAVAHYQHQSSIKNVIVIFDAGGDSSATFGNYTWSAADLTGKSRAN